MEKLVVVIMGQDVERFIGMTLDSVKDADEIIYIDGGSKDKTLDIIKKSKCKLLQHTYDQNDLGMNGKQRNFYLDHIKKHYSDWWCLTIDADEVVGDLSKIKNAIQEIDKGLYSVKMRHFISNLGHEDAVKETHFALHRLFHVHEAGIYPEIEHPVLQPKYKDTIMGQTDITTLWHFAYVPNIWEIKKKYKNHLKKSNSHTKKYLRKWYLQHLFGYYPSNTFGLINIPKVILKEFEVDPDEIYFETHKQIEIRHFFMVKQWVDFFKPKSVLDLGCGVGLYGFVFAYLGFPYKGMERSNWAIENRAHPNLNIDQGDITEKQDYKNYDIVLALDVLEHIEEKDLSKTLKYIKSYGKKFLFSIPYLGDPNLDQDPTHIIKRPKKWWLEQMKKAGLKIEETPEHWVYRNQLLLASNKNGKK